ncbi:MAG: hypothetical protein WCH76_06625 [Candidatus Riflemargulisbacteria bacterium]
MKNIMMITFLSILLSLAWGAKVNILNDDPKVNIYIDGVLAGKGNVSNYELPIGEHYIKIFSGDMIIYAEPLKINDDGMKTINTSYFVEAKKTNIANIGSKKVEAERIKDSRGNFAMGMYFSDSVSGVSVKYFPLGNIGLQFMGWSDSSPGNIYESYMLRPIIQLGNYIILDRHMNSYFALGVGKRVVEKASVREDATILQAMMGAEGTAALLGLPLAIGSIGLLIINNDGNDKKLSSEEAMYLMGFFGGIFLSMIDNAYVNFEMGFERSQDSNGSYKSGIKITSGMHFYF